MAKVYVGTPATSISHDPLTGAFEGRPTGANHRCGYHLVSASTSQRAFILANNPKDLF